MTKEERYNLLEPVVKEVRWTEVAEAYKAVGTGETCLKTKLGGVEFDWINDDWDVLGDKIMSLLDLLSHAEVVVCNVLGEAQNKLDSDPVLMFTACGALWFIKQELISKLREITEKVMEIARVIVGYVSDTHQLKEYIYYIDQIDQDT